MAASPKITVIGASNIDLIGCSKDKLIFKDSNIGTFETVQGGVGRNIAENLARLGIAVEFLSVFGDDEFSRSLKKVCDELEISYKHSLTLENTPTSTYMAIMNRYNDLALGISAMDIYDTLPDSFVLDRLDIIRENDYCVLETNFPRSTLETVTNKLPDVKFALEAVSAKKALRAKSILDRLYILKCNHLEAELLSGLKMDYESDYEKMVEHFLNLGVQKVFITLGKDGVAYGDENEVFVSRHNVVTPVNTNGAGDAFMAGILYGDIKGMELYETVKFATACAAITIQHKKAVHPEINTKLVLDTMVL
ncbi:MAG: carbohydrate kinase family protein [Flavobacteriaceae bacterium]|nr:carbohydrate kinase family protein [Flavobacteriaceae bacterium]